MDIILPKQNKHMTNRFSLVHRTRASCFRAALLWVALLAGGVLTRPAAAQQWVKATPEELSMSSLPGYPGAAAVVLYKEEITRDDMHSVQHYERVKILTEEGKKYANVVLGFVSSKATDDMEGDGKSLQEISGRTVHPDGTIIPYTGKPYLKVIADGKYGAFKQKIFTLPDVTVGSIVEYRYKTYINDHIFESPTWLVQSQLYLREGHFVWYPTLKELHDENDDRVTTISWLPILPKGAEVQHTDMPGGQQLYELKVKNVEPIEEEEFMPPISSYSYRVHFAYTPYRTGEEFWKTTAKKWSKREDSFMQVDGTVRSKAQQLTAGATSESDKAKKIYDGLMQMENTSFTREQESSETRAQGVKAINHVGDVLTVGRGNSRQLTELYVALARAAGLKAYLMRVPDRTENLFVPALQSYDQLSDMIAIVQVDGKAVFVDPGERMCPFGQLAWWHTSVSGVRQTDDNGTFAHTPDEGYKTNETDRVANLTMDAQGQITGHIELRFKGAKALGWRHTGLKYDEEELKHRMQTSLEGMVPKTLEVKVASIKDLTAYEKPLEISFSVRGTLGTSTGKRMLLPADIFEAGTKPAFPHEKRINNIYFGYPESVVDASRINLPANISVEAVPEASKVSLEGQGAYVLNVTGAANNVTTRRQFVFADFALPAERYSKLRGFYTEFESKDKEMIVLKMTTETATSEGAAK